MGGIDAVFAAALLVSVLKGPLYFIVFWACSIPTIRAEEGGRRIVRAFSAAVFRALSGALTTPLLYLAATRTSSQVQGLSPGAHGLVRLLLWAAAIWVVYRKAPFHSPGFRTYFVISVLVVGVALNVALDYVLFQGLHFPSTHRWGC